MNRKMKSIRGILLVALLIAVSFVYAENAAVAQTKAAVPANVVNAALPGGNGQGEMNRTRDMNQTRVMKTPYGARVRLLQLEKAIQRNIAMGESALDVAGNQTGLEDILNQMRALLEEVKEMDPEGSPDALAQAFVDIKSEARSLSKDFRDEFRASVNLTKEQKDQIRERARKRFNQTIEEQIKKARQRYNSFQLNRIFERLGMANNSRIVEQIRDGKMTVKEARKEIRGAYRRLSPDAKKQIRERVKTMRAEALRFRNQTMEKVASGQAERMIKRAELRAKRALSIAREMRSKAKALNSSAPEIRNNTKRTDPVKDVSTAKKRVIS